MSRSQATARSCWLGRLPYRQAWELQAALVEEVRAGAEDTLLLLEHPHVFTLGTRGSLENVLWDEAERARRGADLIWVDRGGDVTYHGPGQLTGYPIFDLTRQGGDLLVYLRRLEESLISYLAEVGVKAASVPGLTGVWQGDAKVAAIGVKKSGPVVSHGFALNLTTDLEYFSGIVPCGLAEKRATSVAALTGRRIGVETAAGAYVAHFERAFGIRLNRLPSLPLIAPA